MQEQEKLLLRDREKFIHIIDGASRQIVSENNKKATLEAREVEMSKSYDENERKMKH